MRLENEFASVELTLDTEGNVPRLRILDLRTGHVRFLDAFELENLSYLNKDELSQFSDPSSTRCRTLDDVLDDLVKP